MNYQHVIMALLLIPGTHALVIQELYPDPFGTETGGEAVLLYNDADTDVDISGWMLDTPSASPDATIPANTVLAPHGIFLIADVGWSLSKDNGSWNAANLEDAITLRNTGGLVAVRDAGGTVIDSISYPTTDEGMALWREGNALTMTEPLFELLDIMYVSQTTGALGNGTAVQVTDNGVPVTAVRPIAGGMKFLSVTIESVREPTLTFMGQLQTMEPLGANRYTADIGINYTTPPGMQSITVVGDTTMTATIDILPLVAVQSDLAYVHIDRGQAGVLTLQGDTTFGTGGLTLRNAGNVEIAVHLSRTTVLRNGVRDSAELRATVDTEIVVSTKSTYAATLLPGQTAPLSITISAPNGKAGNYSTSLALQLKET